MPARDRLTDADAIARLRAKDATLFAEDAAGRDEIAQRLGWVDLASSPVAVGLAASAKSLAKEARSQGITDVVLLGMGGSSLAALVMDEVLAAESCGARLHVLDTVSPVTIARALEETNPATTLHLVSSKSGTTIETTTLYAIFRERADRVLGAGVAGSRFIAITDPDTPLAHFAAEANFRALVLAPANVGGRFSALTAFGILPAALAGADIDLIFERAAAAETACSAPADENPAVELAAFIEDSREAGADKLTLVAPKELRALGLWIEQLVAESLGKVGQGVVPVVELAEEPAGLGPDRAIVVVRMSGDARLAEWAAAQRGRFGVFEIVLDDAYDIAEEFVVWEHAVALVGSLMGVNPFDQPNVAEAKDATLVVLESAAEVPSATVAFDGIHVTFAGALPEPTHQERSIATALGHAIASLGAGDYIALLAYLPNDDQLLEPLTSAVPAVASATGAAFCFELGPRYLHSTGQLHKGGPDNGVFVLVTNRDAVDLEVPGHAWSLKTLHRAQALGDLAALIGHDRRVLWLDLPDASEASVRRLAEALLDGAGVVHEPLS
ncbi:MAG TPA: glucose-6-phosphate isomerase [Coriobacteriia bacterium]|nr:glucose-6-phosphate isomerase [Coriobacteriia bacterium]